MIVSIPTIPHFDRDNPDMGCGITTFNRPHADRELIKSLSNADTEGVSFYVFKDGSEFPFEYEDMDIKVRCSREHLGMPLNTWKCINYVFERHDIGFFLENDMAVSKDYFKYMLKVLARYGGMVSSARNFTDNESPIKIKTNGGGWVTTKTSWLKVKPLLEEYIEDISKMDYANLPSGYELKKYGTSTQTNVRCLKFREAGYDIWQTTVPKTRFTCMDGFHGQDKCLLEITQSMIDNSIIK